LLFGKVKDSTISQLLMFLTNLM